MSELPEWKKRALADPNVNAKQARVIMDGPKCLTDAWFLQAMKFKYFRDEPRNTTTNVED